MEFACFLQLIHRHKRVAAIAVEVDDVEEDGDRGLAHYTEKDNCFVGSVGGGVIKNVTAAGGGVGKNENNMVRGVCAIFIKRIAAWVFAQYFPSPGTS